MPTITPQSLYFSGQGTVWAARVALDGTPMGFRPLGNVSSLVLTPEHTRLEKKSLKSGPNVSAGDDTTGVGGTLTASVESLNSANLSMLAGDYAQEVQAQNWTYSAAAYPGTYFWLPHINILAMTAVAMHDGGGALVAYTAPGVAYDYRLDENAGLLFINDGVEADVVNLGAVAPAVTAYSSVGGFLRLTVAGSPLKARSYGTLRSPGAGLNGGKALRFQVTAVGAGYLDTDIDVSAGLPAFAGTPRVIGGQTLDASFNIGAYLWSVGAPTVINKWAFLFIGLNGVDGKLYRITVPKAVLKGSLTNELINGDIASLPLQADLVFNARSPEVDLFQIEALPQGYVSVMPPG